MSQPPPKRRPGPRDARKIGLRSLRGCLAAACNRRGGPRHTWKSRDCRKFSRWEETILEKHRTVLREVQRGVDSAGEWQILPPPFAEFHCAAPRWRELFPYARWRREKELRHQIARRGVPHGNP